MRQSEKPVCFHAVCRVTRSGKHYCADCGKRAPFPTCEPHSVAKNAPTPEAQACLRE